MTCPLLGKGIGCISTECEFWDIIHGCMIKRVLERLYDKLWMSWCEWERLSLEYGIIMV